MMETQMLIGRIVLFILTVIIAYHIAFNNTPELKGVQNAWLYRASYGMMVWRGLGYIAFSVFGLFPME